MLHLERFFIFFCFNHIWKEEFWSRHDLLDGRSCYIGGLQAAWYALLLPALVSFFRLVRLLLSQSVCVHTGLQDKAQVCFEFVASAYACLVGVCGFCRRKRGVFLVLLSGGNFPCKESGTNGQRF